MSMFTTLKTSIWTRDAHEAVYVPPPILPVLLQENGDPILQENGDYILLED